MAQQKEQSLQIISGGNSGVGEYVSPYDSNGNTTNKQGKTYAYNFENRLTQATDINGSTAFSNDGDGNRVAKTVNGVTTHYLVDTNNLTGYAQVVEELQSGAVVKQFTYGLDLISQRSGGVSFYGYDGQGSVRYLTGANGAITDTYDYDAFGNLIARTGNTDNEYLYTGERFDPNLGFYYLRARYMNPANGRFQNMDSFEGDRYAPASLHKYTYVHNDPANRIDPSGNISLADTQITVGLIITLAVLSVATLCAFQFAASNTLSAAGYGSVLEAAPSSPCISKQPEPKRIFYRGTSFYDAEEAILTQQIDISRIISNQNSFGFAPDRFGVYFTSQLPTAVYYADLAGGSGRGGGPGIIKAIVPARRFAAFAIRYGIVIEAPIPQPPLPGQTETLIPFEAMREFETFADYR